jgi:hypothetical protein
VYAGCDFVGPLQVKGEKLPPRLRIKHQLFRCLCRSTEHGRKPPRSEGPASRDHTPAPGHAQKTPLKNKGFAGLAGWVTPKRSMADTAPAARPGCDRFKTSCLIPLNPRKRLEER